MPVGPTFKRSAALVANGTYQPLQAAPAWQHRFPAVDAVLSYTLDAVLALNAEYEITSGSETLVQRSPVGGGGTAGEFASFQEHMDSVIVFAGQEVAITIFEIAAGTTTVNLEVHLTPA